MTVRHPSASTPNISVSVDNALLCETPEELSLEKLKFIGRRYATVQLNFQLFGNDTTGSVESRALAKFDIEQPGLQVYNQKGDRIIAVFTAPGEEELDKRQIPLEGTAFRPVVFDVTPVTDEDRPLIQAFLDGYLDHCLTENSWATAEGLRTPAMYFSASLGAPNVAHAEGIINGVRMGINIFSVGDVIQMKRLLLIDTAQEAPQDA